MFKFNDTSGGEEASWLVLQSERSGFASPGWEHCVVFLGKTLNSHGASLHTDVYMSTGEFNAGGATLRWTGIPSRGEYKYS